MSEKPVTLEHLLYALAVVLGLSVRLLHLGGEPLSDAEASWALQALAVARGGPAEIGAQPGYVLLSGFLFFLFGESSALARGLPAFIGALLVIAPYLARQRLGRLPALILAFGLALDPGFIALSRQADGLMMAVGFGVLALVTWQAGWPFLAGALAGLGLLSGPAALTGLLTIMLAWGLGRWLPGVESITGWVGPSGERGPAAGGWRASLLTGGGAILLAGTLFFRFPQGIGALAQALPTFLQGWFNPSGVPALRLLAALAFYAPLPLIFGLVHSLRAWLEGDQTGRLLSLWALSGLVLAVLYPARSVGDLAWALVPLWALAAMELARTLYGLGADRLTSLGQSGLILVFLVYVWLNLSGLARFDEDSQARLVRWELIGGAVLLIAITTFLISKGWSQRVARDGLVWGLWAGLGLFTLSAGWMMGVERPARVQEWWFPSPVTQEIDLLVDTIGDVAEWHTGRRDSIALQVMIDTPSLRWALRDFPQAEFSPGVNPGDLPDLAITGMGSEPRLAAGYRGTDFGWQSSLVWEGALPAQTLKWLVFREGLLETQQLILWARNDLFLDGTLRLPEQGGSVRIPAR